MTDEIARIRSFINGLVWGLVFAAGLFVFFETKNGQELKKKLKEGGEDLLNDLEEWFDKLEERGEKVVEVKKEAEETVEEDLQEREAIIEEEIIRPVAAELKTSLDHIEALQEHGREIKRHLFKNIPRRGIPRLS